MSTDTAVDVDRLCIDTIRFLAADAVQKANSGHPGTPMALAPVAYTLYTKHLRHDPADPAWPDRDRFVLSAGHASMLLYSILHLSGYDLPLAELERFRQWGSRTPGHPEHDREVVIPGVETTTGPLGQGFGNGVGFAMAERFLRDRYGSEVQDHRVFAICSDGDLMEGVASEAASIAGHLGLGRIVYVYDDNDITIDGHTNISFRGEDVDGRFDAYGWHTQHVPDVNDLGALDAAIEAAIAEEERPSLIRVNSVIAFGAPKKHNTPGAHGSPLGEDEIRATKEAFGWDPDRHFYVPDEVRAHFAPVKTRGAELSAAWRERFAAWREADAERAAEWDLAWAGKPGPGLDAALPDFDPEQTPKIATRSAGGKVMAAFAPHVPTMIGGAADLVASTKTTFPDGGDFSREAPGRNIHWGVREHGMGAAVNGLALHGGIVKPYGSTFLIFSDYMRGSIRLSALMRAQSVWVFSHDSLGVGEDGPTHQPVEQLASLRAIPGLVVLRPGDGAETAEAWRVILEEIDGPAVLVLSRQDLPVLDRGGSVAAASGLANGAYVLVEAGDGSPAAVLVATGSEVEVALEARAVLEAEGISTRVVSMPSWELFSHRSQEERDAVLPPGVPKVSIEAGVSFGWERWVDASVAVDRFGASAPGEEVLRNLGITADHAVEVVRGLVS